MEVSVVICVYNERAVIGDTVAAVLADPGASEVVVVVDGSEDGSYEFLKAMADSDSRLKPFFISNRGRAGARQFGLEQVSNEVVLLLDADVVPVGRLVSGHARRHADGRPRIVVGYMPVAPDHRGSCVSEAYSGWYEYQIAEYERDPTTILSRLWGGNISLPMAYIDDAGGFDGHLGINYHVDLDFGLRLGATDIEPVFDRSLLAEHRFSKSVDGYLNMAFNSGFAKVIIASRFPQAFPDGLSERAPTQSPAGWHSNLRVRELVNRRWLLVPVARIGRTLMRWAHRRNSRLEDSLMMTLFQAEVALGRWAGIEHLAKTAADTDDPETCPTASPPVGQAN